MTERVDKLEADVRKAVKLGWVTAACSMASLLLKLFPPAAAPVGHPSPAPAPAPQASGNTVTIGASSAPDPARDFDTVAEFAAANGMAPRTVLSYISAGRIEPSPVKDGREWIIPRGSRIQPHSAANNR